MNFQKKIAQLGQGGTRFFQNTRATEVTELQDGLGSNKIEKQKEAMKQIIASMTIGKDVSMLFPQVVKCIRTKNIELKKLVYLYLINYAKVKPDLTFLAVASFHTDAKDGETPLIRGLAIRTMGCIRVPMIVSYLCETLTFCFKDPDAYVRKTAALCVAKLFATSPALVKENGFTNILIEMLKDTNAMVVANSLVALTEISVLSNDNLMKIKSKVLKKILSLIPEANEWGQIAIMDSLVLYTPKKTKKSNKSEDIIEAVLPRLSHANPSVVMSSIKVVLKYMDHIENIDKVRNYSKKVANSLMSVMMAFPEIQYVLLRGLQAIVQKRPSLLDKDFKFFFVQYNDPIYVKLEKVDILYKLCDSKNFEAILKEFTTYSLTELDPELVKKSIRYIGFIGYKFDRSVDICVESLKQILDNQHDEALDESIIVSRDLLRKYKGRTLELIKKITINLIDSITDANAKSAAFYIIGEFCTMIPNSTEIINHFIDDFSNDDLEPKVKLQLLNACVKNFVNKPTAGEESVQICLQKGAEESENQDVRDRAYFFWRLLETDPDIAKEMMISEKPPFDFDEDSNMIDSDKLDNLIDNMTNVSCIYLKNSKELITFEEAALAAEPGSDKDNKEGEEGKEGKEGKESKKKSKKESKVKKQEVKEEPIGDADLLGLDDDIIENPMPMMEQGQQPQQQQFNNMDLLNDLFGGSSNPSPQMPYGQPMNPMSMPMGMPMMSNIDSPPKSIFSYTNGPITPILQVFSQSSLKIYSSFQRSQGRIQLGIFIINQTPEAFNSYQLYFERNSFGLGLNSCQSPVIPPNSTQTVIYDIVIDKQYNDMQPPTFPYEIQSVFKFNNQAVNMKIPIQMHVMFIEGWKLSGPEFIDFFSKNKSQPWNSGVFTYNNYTNEEQLKKVFEANNISFSAKNNKNNPPSSYFSANISNVVPILIECWFTNGVLNLKVIANHDAVSPLVKEAVDTILK